MRTGIVTDSTSDLPPERVKRLGIVVVPALVILDGREYVDGVNLSRQEFYQRLPALREVSTAAPSIGEFQRAYRQLFEAGARQIVSIHVAASLSAICQVACMAAQEFAGRVEVVDSGQLSFGLGLQVLAAAEAARRGESLEAIHQAIRSTRQRLWVKAALDTMEYLRRSGRVSNVVARLGGAFHVRPLIELRDGMVKAIGLVRTPSQAEAWLARDLRSLPRLERLAILHTGAEARAQRFLERMRQELGDRWPEESWLINVTAVIGAHLGPNGLGYAAVRAAD
ncbi:MAG: DegV family protein [Chloroflexi bacterium]|nr:DegV family protein [Chloroflexota bacterium]